MDLAARLDLDLGDLRLRKLLPDDAGLLVEATRHEQAPALWAPRPAGPYSLEDARTALHRWDPARGERASFGVLRADRLVAALGLMLTATARKAPSSPTGCGRSSGGAASACEACTP
jgi:hypothetical protein